MSSTVSNHFATSALVTWPWASINLDWWVTGYLHSLEILIHISNKIDRCFQNLKLACRNHGAKGKATDVGGGGVVLWVLTLPIETMRPPVPQAGKVPIVNANLWPWVSSLSALSTLITIMTPLHSLFLNFCSGFDRGCPTLPSPSSALLAGLAWLPALDFHSSWKT